MGPNFSLQHPNSTSEAANKVTRDNSLGDSFWTIFSSGHCDTRKGIQSCKILLFGHFQGWARLNHGWPGIVLVTVLLLVRGWAREPPETLLTTSTSVIHLSCSKKEFCPNFSNYSKWKNSDFKETDKYFTAVGKLRCIEANEVFTVTSQECQSHEQKQNLSALANLPHYGV